MPNSLRHLYLYLFLNRNEMNRTSAFVLFQRFLNCQTTNVTFSKIFNTCYIYACASMCFLVPCKNEMITLDMNDIFFVCAICKSLNFSKYNFVTSDHETLILRVKIKNLFFTNKNINRRLFYFWFINNVFVTCMHFTQMLLGEHRINFKISF